MKASEVVEHFVSRADWVNRADTVDRVIFGDPGLEADRCVVTWIPRLPALEEAVRRGVRLVLCHEPTFYNHRDDRPERWDETVAIVFEKQEFLRRHGLTVVRLHDTWDRWPEVGIPWAWAQFLGLKGRPVQIGAAGYQHRYDIDPMPLEEFARGVARRCAAIGEPQVQVTGDGAAMVSKIGIGTGCGCDLEAYRVMGCDASIVCDDGSCYWGGIQMAEDRKHPVIRVNHGTSEEPGMVTLTRYVNEHLTGLRAEHLPHGSTFRLVG